MLDAKLLRTDPDGLRTALARRGAVLATNTSTLDIEAIAVATSRPEDVIGMHFFSPANVMPLLEVVRTGRTSPVAIKTVMELAKPLRKTPVRAGTRRTGSWASVRRAWASVPRARGTARQG